MKGRKLKKDKKVFLAPMETASFFCYCESEKGSTDYFTSFAMTEKDIVDSGTAFEKIPDVVASEYSAIIVVNLQKI